jgi:uncharacterized protein YbbC (DUF1343 family)
MTRVRARQPAGRGLGLLWVTAGFLPWCLYGCDPPDRPADEVRPGIEVLATDSVHLLRDLRVGLITNHTGVARDGTPAARLLLDAGVRVEVLLSPEHGLSGTVAGGRSVPDRTDPVTGLPVQSLYGSRRMPEDHLLEGVDVLVFDLQDIGARYYTYASTMLEAMRAAAAKNIAFVVADRPNPIGGELVQGNVLDARFVSFVGPHTLAMRHGMTVGELARMFNRELDLDLRLIVIPATGWKRSQWSDATGIPWIPTSPNIPDLESATHYPGTCLFEGTNLSVGRGTEQPFQQIGAPWLELAEAGEIVERLAGSGLSGVRLDVVSFTPDAPDDGKYAGAAVVGVRLTVTDRKRYDPVHTAVWLLREMRRLAGDRWEWNPDAFDRLAGTDRLRLAIEDGDPAEEIIAAWRGSLAAFRARRSAYLLYP